MRGYLADMSGLLLFLAATLTPPTVCIDPGHPSEVGRGTQGRHSTEIGVAWMLAKDLQTQLERRGIHVVLTKGKEQQKVLNRRRAEVANEARADLMIRLHCDASTGTGFTVYYPDRVGQVGGFRGPSAEVLRTSHAAAIRVHQAMAEVLRGKLADGGLKSDIATAVGSHQGALTGSIYSKVPVVLVETVVLTNRKDEAFILSKAGRAAMVDALTKGVLNVVQP